MNRTRILCILFLCISVLLSSCDRDDIVRLEVSDQEEIVSFLSLHEDRIRAEYEEWKGSVVDFSVGFEIPVSTENRYEVDVSLLMNGRFFIDRESYITYFYETLNLSVGKASVMEITCMGYMDGSNTMYYDQYRIDGILLSNQYHFLCVEAGQMMDAEKWMDFFSPTEFLFALYDYSFEELSDLGETFYFAQKGDAMTCRVEHSIDYMLEESLLDWEKMGEIFSDDYLAMFGVDWTEMANALQNEEVKAELREQMQKIDHTYYTEYEFDNNNLTGAEVVQRTRFDEALDGIDGMLYTTRFTLRPLKQSVSFDPRIYNPSAPFVDISDYFDGIDMDMIWGETP